MRVGGGVPIADAFGDAKLFGALKLTDVIDTSALPTQTDFAREPNGNALMAVPPIRTQRIQDGDETRSAWKPRLRAQAAGALPLQFRPTLPRASPPTGARSGRRCKDR